MKFDILVILHTVSPFTYTTKIIWKLTIISIIIFTKYRPIWAKSLIYALAIKLFSFSIS